MTHVRVPCACVAVLLSLFACTNTIFAQTSSGAGPHEDVEEVTTEAKQTPQKPLVTVDRPIYDGLQALKADLSEKYGITFAIEDTLIYQATSGGVNPNDAMVNTLGFFGTWKIFRSDDGIDFAGPGIQAETRGNHTGEFTKLRDDLGSLWSPNDSTSDDYTKINQLWWGQRFGDGRFGYIVGKIDPGSRLNGNRFAGSGNTQFFGQPYATNPARSFPDNGLGFIARAEITDEFYGQFMMSDSDAVSTHDPFTSIHGHWLYAAEAAYAPRNFAGLGQGTYRFMLYDRDATEDNELGWAVSADQNLTDDYGVFLRYGGNDGDLSAIEHLLSVGLSFLHPFGRENDQAGFAFAYTHPQSSDFRDEYSTEAYYRVQVTEGFELSGSAQLIFDPSAGSQDAVAVFGLRARILY